MAEVLFYMHILATIGMLVMPLTAATRGRAIYDWFAQLMVAGMLSYLIEAYYPSWEEPHWHTGNTWALVAWAVCILGLIVAIRKPRKQSVPAT